MIRWVCLLILIFADWSLGKVKHDPTYTNRWLAKIEGGEQAAQRVARQLGYTYKGQFGQFEDYYELVMDDHPRMSTRDSNHLTSSLLDLSEVKWARQQKLSKFVYKQLSENANPEIEKAEGELVKYMENEAKKIAKSPDGPSCTNIFSCIRFPFSFRNLFKRLSQGNISKLGTFSTKPAPHSQLTKYKGTTKNIQLLSKKISAYEIYFTDPLWTKQWAMQDYRTTDIPVMDHNVVPVYKMGITGKGVTVAIVDTEVETNHPDLQDNIDIDKSYDMCLDKPLKEVTEPRKIATRHGTGCAGIVAMIPNNDICGVGVAYGAKIAAININCEHFTDADEGRALLQNYKMIDISSNSWGSEDDSKTVCVLDDFTAQAYKTGATEGRQGKGIIYLHSAGNGGLLGDRCDTDCSLNQPYVIAITSANQYGKKSDYSERCSAIFATAYTGNTFPYKGKDLERTVSLKLGGRCDLRFAGTSASCPLAAGMIALTLEANPDLSYRDVMHIIARTAEVAPLADNESWNINANGFWVSEEFGFGLLNAENMVLLAKRWISVPEKHTCTVNIKLDNPETLGWNQKVSVPFDTEACQLSETGSVFYLEHLEVASIVEYPYRGDIKLYITSPGQMKTLLLGHRRNDGAKEGIAGWSIMSLHTWGEDPNGKWIIEVEIDDPPLDREAKGLVKEFVIQFHGIGSRPDYLEEKRPYAAFRLPNGITEDGKQG